MELQGQIAIIGLGRMGKGIARRLLKANIKTVVVNRSPEAVQELAAEGAIAAQSVEEACQKLLKPRVLWFMLPQGEVTQQHLIGDGGVINYAEPGDIVVDGGNANFHSSQWHAQKFLEKDIHFLDAGTSGGLVGESEGYCVMVGGPKEAYDHVAQFLEAIAQPEGYGYYGQSGAGHFVKMIHNAIEYGMMQAYGEGLDLIKNSDFKDVSLKDLVHVWNHGSIIESFLGETIETELATDNNLDTYPGEVGYTGEGKWAIDEALRLGVPFSVITEAMFARYRSTQDKTFANKVVAAMRHGFGGHTNAERT